MADALPVADALKASINLARKRPMAFGLCLGKKPEETVLIMHKIKAGEILARQAKKAGNTSKIAYGTLETRGKVVTLNCEADPPAGLLKKTKQYFKSLEMPMRILILDPQGEEFEADDGGEEDLIGATEESPSPEAARWQKIHAQLDPVIQELNGPSAEKIAAAWQGACQKAEAGDYAQAVAVGIRILDALKKKQAAKPADGSGANLSAELANLAEETKELSLHEPRVSDDMQPLLSDVETKLEAGHSEAAHKGLAVATARLKTWRHVANQTAVKVLKQATEKYESDIEVLDQRADALIAQADRLEAGPELDKMVDAMMRLADMIQERTDNLRKLRRFGATA